MLPGVVVEAAASRRHMALGAAALAARGSGGARLAVSAEPAPAANELEEAGQRVGPTLVARSSTSLEEGGEWAGAFSSYVGVSPGELAKAVVGCWASAFTVDALRRQQEAGVTPGSFDMAVLVQPSLHPRAGGAAEIHSSGEVVVYGVAGAPQPLLQGWVTGQEARLTTAGTWAGPLLDLVSQDHLGQVATALRRGADQLAVDRCEWAVTDRAWILQLSRVYAQDHVAVDVSRDVPAALIPFARAAMTVSGRLGEELALPWAVNGIPPARRSSGAPPDPTRARMLSARLTAQVWGGSEEEAARRATRFLSGLRSGAYAVSGLDQLGRPDPEEAAELLAIMDSLARALDDDGIPADTARHLSLEHIEAVLSGATRTAPSRIGTGPWEPLVAAVVLTHGRRSSGTPAAPGIGAGVRSHVSGPVVPEPGGHRRVITAPYALPNLSQLLWDASGVVTRAGSPAAHVFEAARSVGIPAVCGVDPGPDDRMIVAVDGYAGVVATLPLDSRP